MGRLFGTDGVRGVANSELTCEMAMNIGRAAAMVLTDNNHRHPKILIGKDTRLSSDMLENALTAGLCSVGANVVKLGVVPTPAVAFLVGKYKADAGVMISASHNPCEFNGIKIFSGDGYKLPDALEEQIEAGACGLKIHEDWGSTPAAIRAALGVADRFDVQVAIHSDTLNESGYVEDTIAAMDGRTIHTYHTEGAGGGHAPDLLKVASMPYVLPSSTNPTLPFGINSQAELFDMIMVCHNLNPKIPSDVAFAESRVRPETQAAENVLHDLGVLSMVSSDSQAMGRIGESFMRTFQMASFMKNACGKLTEDADGNDNFRVLRYIAKITINPAITYGVSDYLGSVEKGKVADLVLWEPQFFGAKPKMVIKGGLINWSNMGDPNASLPTPQPCYYRPMYGAFGHALPETCLSFVSNAAFQSGIKERLHLHRMVQPVRRTRQLTKYDMVRNGGMPKIDVNPETFDVLVNDIRAYVKPADKFPLSQLLWFS